MDNNKVSFNKRIRLVKKEVFDIVTQSNELGKIKDSQKTGYYSLRVIFDALHIALDKFGVDVEPVINKDNVVFTWYDDDSEKTRETLIDFSNLVGLQKLPMMANIVQSEGAVKSYIRRYAYTTLLNLNSTDIIEHNKPQDQPKRQDVQRQYTSRQQKPQKPEQKPAPKPAQKITHNNLKAYYATMSEKGFKTEEDKKLIDRLVKEAFQLKSKNDWLDVHYHNFMDFVKKSDKETIKMSLERKIQKKGERAKG